MRGNSRKQRIKSLCDNTLNEETLDLAFGTLAGEFVRTRVTPEIDALNVRAA